MTTESHQSSAGWLARLTLPNILISLPVAHLLVASLYTWGWLSGFGANISVLADPRDLFSVSISKLVNVYLIGLVLPVVQLLFMLRQASKPNKRAGPSARAHRWTQTAVTVSLWLLLVQSTLVSFDLIHRGLPQGLSMLIAVNLAGVLAYKFLLDHVQFSDDIRYANIAIGLLCSSLAFGLADGNFARYRNYEVYQHRLPHCAGMLVQRRFGDSYVAITRDSSNVVTDLECKVVMTIPAVRAEARREFHWRPYPHLHYVLLEGNAPLHGVRDPHASAAPRGQS